MPDPRRFDVVVVGAGPAGSATARRLAQSGCRVLLIERGRFETLRAGETLAPIAQQLLLELGVWERFLGLDPLPSWGTKSIWGQAAPLQHSHLMSPYGCGWHVERARFDEMLALAASEAGASLQMNARVIQCEHARDEWELTVEQNHESRAVRARIVIDGSGRRAALARLVGARRITLDRLMGAAVQFELSEETERYTLVETVPEGWWYSAPLREHRMMLMLMSDADQLRSVYPLGTARRSSLLERAPHTRRRVAYAVPAWGPRVFNAMSHRLWRGERSRRWLAVGDSALAVDPISGSGVVRALRMADECADTAVELLDRSSSEPIEQYESRRDGDCESYLRERAAYYRIERRWSDFPFWQRRTPAPAP